MAKAAGGVPLLAYHYPAASAPGISVEVLDDLPVAGLKDSSGDAERLLREVEGYSGLVYVGSPMVLTMAGAVGADGALLAVGNAEPELCVAAFGGDGTAQRRLLEPHRAARGSFPAGIKHLTARRFGTPETARMGA